MFAVGTLINNVRMLTLTSLPAATVMDLRPTVIQLLDQLELPVLPWDPSVRGSIDVWYVGVFQHNPPESSQSSFMAVVFLVSILD